MSVLVLMSTYNGERFLSKQIESVLAQQGFDIHILVRDDGSSDGTVPLLEEYVKRNANMTLIRGKNCGCAYSFMELVREAAQAKEQYDYYAFCDQDDYWEPTKIAFAVQALSEVPLFMPSLYLGAYQMVDAELNKIDTPTLNPLLNLPAAIVSNIATGCTMVFNRGLLDVVASKMPEYLIMHDYWVYLVCLAVGGCVMYDKTPYILYRQHSANVIGGKSDPFLKRWWVRCKKLFRKGDFFKSKTAESLLECFGDQMSEENRKFLQDVTECRKWRSKLRLWRNPKFKGGTFDGNIQLFGLVFTGKF